VVFHWRWRQERASGSRERSKSARQVEKMLRICVKQRSLSDTYVHMKKKKNQAGKRTLVFFRQLLQSKSSQMYEHVVSLHLWTTYVCGEDQTKSTVWWWNLFFLLIEYVRESFYHCRPSIILLCPLVSVWPNQGNSFILEKNQVFYDTTTFNITTSSTVLLLLKYYELLPETWAYNIPHQNDKIKWNVHPTYV
jgi:hypothetical protein